MGQSGMFVRLLISIFPRFEFVSDFDIRISDLVIVAHESAGAVNQPRGFLFISEISPKLILLLYNQDSST